VGRPSIRFAFHDKRTLGPREVRAVLRATGLPKPNSAAYSEVTMLRIRVTHHYEHRGEPAPADVAIVHLVETPAPA
jgi:hypothetical protein